MTTESIDLDSIKGEMRRILHDMGVFIDFGRYQLHDMAPLMAKLGLKILSGHLAGWGEKAIGKAEKGRGCKARETRLKTSTEKVKANLTNLNGLSEAMQEVRDALREI